MPYIFSNITRNISAGYNITNDIDNKSTNYNGAIIVLTLISFIVLMCCFSCFSDVIYKCCKKTTTKITKCCFKLKRTKKKNDYNFIVKNCLIIDKLENKENCLIIDKFENNENCPICLDQLINNEKLLKINSCGHIFHSNCIYPWFDVQFKDNKYSLNCPLCRESVNILWEKPQKNISIISNVSTISDLSFYYD